MPSKKYSSHDIVPVSLGKSVLQFPSGLRNKDSKHYLLKVFKLRKRFLFKKEGGEAE